MEIEIADNLDTISSMDSIASDSSTGSDSAYDDTESERTHDSPFEWSLQDHLSLDTTGSLPVLGRKFHVSFKKKEK